MPLILVSRDTSNWRIFLWRAWQAWQVTMLASSRTESERQCGCGAVVLCAVCCVLCTVVPPSRKRAGERPQVPSWQLVALASTPTSTTTHLETLQTGDDWRWYMF